jgi:ribosomal protein L29
MPLPKASDFRAKTDEELSKDLENFGKEIATLPDTKYGRKQSLRKLVARILTVINERNRAAKAKKALIPAQKQAPKAQAKAPAEAAKKQAKAPKAQKRPSKATK